MQSSNNNSSKLIASKNAYSVGWENWSQLPRRESKPSTVVTVTKCEKYSPRFETIRIESIVVWTRADGTPASIGHSQNIRVLRNACDEGISEASHKGSHGTFD
jgi:hypothetical protein